MKEQTLTTNEIRFILAVNATWAVLRDPVLTKIYHKEWIRIYPRPQSVNGNELTLYGYVFNVMYGKYEQSDQRKKRKHQA